MGEGTKYMGERHVLECFDVAFAQCEVQHEYSCDEPLG